MSPSPLVSQCLDASQQHLELSVPTLERSRVLEPPAPGCPPPALVSLFQNLLLSAADIFTSSRCVIVLHARTPSEYQGPSGLSHGFGETSQG